MPPALAPPRPRAASSPRAALAALLALMLMLVWAPSPAGAAPGAGAADTRRPRLPPRRRVDPLVSEGRAVPDLSFVPGSATVAELEAAEALARSAYAGLVAVWAPLFGTPIYVNVRLIRPGDPVEVSACDPGTPVNVPLTAFYCTIDDTIWLNDLLLVGFHQRFGPFAVETVVAHEYAHRLQRQAGVFAVARAVVDVELQADCLAGAWSRTRAQAGLLSEIDVAAATAAVAAVGDTELTDPNHHGTPAQRQAAWFRGLNGQDCPLGGI